ncbi:winged helix-turn-helix domain-containing protein [Paenibacillus sp. GCM10012307]|uniref:Winged helix-turn-helix domain-containing protein n=1 Tax=Paenibacillus roseus TaxID=2798579 RepID=A0A934J3Q0_9BACL|nr:winged helix-turn-helix domain-containing protein [Paenibacillus roseus]
MPANVGFIAKFNWTLQLISKYSERHYGFHYSLRGNSKLIERMNMSYTKPTYTVAAVDAAKQQSFVEETCPSLKGVKLAKFVIFCSRTKVRSATNRPCNEHGLKK